MMLKNPNEWFAAGRIMAGELMPYFKAAVMGLYPYKMEGLGTLGVTERGVLLWDPELCKKWDVQHLAWVLLHEAGHYLRDHATRGAACGARDANAFLWNIAGDAEINDDLIAGGAVFPVFTEKDCVPPEMVGKVTGITPEKIGCQDGRLCEEYFEHLRRNAKVQPQKGEGDEGGGSGNPQVTLDSAGSEEEGAGDGTGQKPGKGRGKGKGRGGGRSPGPIFPQLGGKGCGSGAGGKPLPGEDKVPAELGKSKAEQKRIQREVAEAVRHAAESGRGNVPMGLRRWADETLGAPRVSWQQKLASVCRAAIAYRPGAGDYRYDRPSRRQSAFGYGTGAPVFPALRMPVPRVVEVVDTSGSMGDAELKTALEESKGILTAVGASVDFLACDAAVHELRKVRNIQEAVRALKGGGGTDFRPAFQAAMQLKPKPEVLVFITDGDGPAPEVPPRGIKVIWLLVGPHRRRPSDWGEVVELDSSPVVDR